MERDHWLGRKRASFMLAGPAASAEARLLDHQLTGPEEPIRPVADYVNPSPRGRAGADERYYNELAQGAEYLASRADDAVEVAEHTRMAARYLSRAREAAWGERLAP